MKEQSHQTIPLFLNSLKSLYNDREYLVYYERRYTYSEFLHWTGRLSKGLLNLGFVKGDKLALWISNFPEWIALWFACQRIGVIPVPINTRFRKGEVSYIIKSSQVKGIVTMDHYLNTDYLGIIKELLPQITHKDVGEWSSDDFPSLNYVITISNDCPKGAITLEHLELLGERMSYEYLEYAEKLVHPLDPACLLFTSGTTSFPKGVLLAHHQIIMNGKKSGDRLGLTCEDRFLAVLPLFSSFMCLNGIFSVTSHGGCIVLQDHYETGEMLQLIEKEEITVIYGPETIFKDIINHPERKSRNISTWKKGIGAPLHKNTIKQLINIGVTGMIHAYGLTETSAICAAGDPEDQSEARLSTVGKPLPGIEIKIMNPETNEFLKEGEEGEIVVKGPSLLLRYEGRPLQTLETTLPGGWFRTGDIGKITPAGDLIFLGRNKDMLKVGGFNVAPAEIEEFISSFEEVEKAAVVGIPDERLQEVPAVFIKLLPGKTLTEKEVLERCQQIANFKRPKKVRFVNSFPMTETGKIKKNELIAELSNISSPHN